jgi:hypothetical protein
MVLKEVSVKRKLIYSFYISFMSLWQIPEINQLKRRKGLFWLLVSQVSDPGPTAMSTWWKSVHLMVVRM